jgi:hypothetical protein
MSNYTYPNSSWTFAERDSFPPSDPEKVVKGIQVEAECLALVTAVNSKMNLEDPVFNGNMTGGTIDGGTY